MSYAYMELCELVYVNVRVNGYDECRERENSIDISGKSNLDE